MPREEINLICDKISLHRILQTKNSWSFVCVTPAPCCKKTPLFQPSDIYIYTYCISSKSIAELFPPFQWWRVFLFFEGSPGNKKKSAATNIENRQKNTSIMPTLTTLTTLYSFLTWATGHVWSSVMKKFQCCCLRWGHGRCEFLILGLGWLVCSRFSELIVVLFSGGKVWLILFYIYIRAGWGVSFIQWIKGQCSDLGQFGFRRM